MAFPNIYMHRKVAETSARNCEICYKPSTSVLITPENKDFFYVCTLHLKDSNFCTPKIDPAEVEARKKRQLEEEMKRVKDEYEEKQRKKKEKEEEKKKKKDEKDGEKAKDDEAKKDGEKTEETEPDTKSPESEEEEPRVFILKNAFYQQRLTKKRLVELAKRNKERMQDPNFFPSVPKGLP